MMQTKQQQQELSSPTATTSNFHTTTNNSNNNDNTSTTNMTTTTSSFLTTLANCIATLCCIPLLVQAVLFGWQQHQQQHHCVPPAIIGMGLFTLVALLVHPDGLTWVLIRCVRDGFFMILHSSSTIWTVLVNDHGTIISSILALFTFAALFLVAFSMHRTLASRTPKCSGTEARLSEKQKRKQRRKARAAGKGRIRSSVRSSSAATEDESEPTTTTTSATAVSSEQQRREPIVQLPPLVEDKSVISLPIPSVSEKPPDCVDSVSSSVDDTSGNSASIVVTAAERPTVVTTTKRIKPKQHSNKPRRQHQKQQPPPPLPTPSKRWDALKPSARSTPPPPPRRTQTRLKPPVSDLNPETPAWKQPPQSHNTPTNTATTYLRPPPGLDHPSVPFGCSSTDEHDDDASLLVLRQLDISACLNASSSTSTTTTTMMHPVHETVPEQQRTTLLPDDTNDLDSIIEAELQVLGGQMVGSILDF